MSRVGPAVREIRFHMEKEHRVIYVARFEEAVYVLHAFVKKTPKTPKGELQLAAQRYRDLQKSRRG